MIPWNGPILQIHVGKRNKMLAPLTGLVGKCGQTKITKAKEAKQVPWNWDEVHQIKLLTW